MNKNQFSTFFFNFFNLLFLFTKNSRRIKNKWKINFIKKFAENFYVQICKTRFQYTSYYFLTEFLSHHFFEFFFKNIFSFVFSTIFCVLLYGWFFPKVSEKYLILSISIADNANMTYLNFYHSICESVNFSISVLFMQKMAVKLA